MTKVKNKMEDWLYQHAAIGTLVEVDQVSQIIDHNFSNLTFYEMLVVFRDVNQAWGCYHNLVETERENGNFVIDDSLCEPIQDLITALNKHIISFWYYGGQHATI